MSDRRGRRQTATHETIVQIFLLHPLFHEPRIRSCHTLSILPIACFAHCVGHLLVGILYSIYKRCPAETSGQFTGRSEPDGDWVCGERLLQKCMEVVKEGRAKCQGSWIRGQKFM